MLKATYFVICFALKTVLISSQSCEFVIDLKVSYKDLTTTDPEWNAKTITGCISDKSFEPKRVTDISCDCQQNSILRLERGFINNMNDVREIKIGVCYIAAIEPGAFLNLPRLERLEIHANPYKTVPSGVFNIIPSLQVLYLIDSKISSIEDNAFSNLPNFKRIFVDRCQLEEIKREWFTNTSNIEHFSVYRNKIRKVPAGMFHGWKKLKMLNLNSNAISVIEGAIFRGNPPLIRNLDLHHNRLTSLDPDMIPDSTFIEHFSVSANLLNFIPEKLLRKIHAANMVIFSNPFSCPCLDKINEILLDNGVQVDNSFFAYVSACKNSDIPVCVTPANDSKTCVEAVDKQLTKKMISMMKDVRYDVVFDPFGQQCAMFDEVD